MDLSRYQILKIARTASKKDCIICYDLKSAFIG